MKRLVAAVLFVSVGLAATPSMAQSADDVKWINQCINDNKGEPGATPAIAKAYCTCMNDKMEDSERRSITQWEKTHKRERDACSKQAGWN